MKLRISTVKGISVSIGFLQPQVSTQWHHGPLLSMPDWIGTFQNKARRDCSKRVNTALTRLPMAVFGGSAAVSLPLRNSFIGTPDPISYRE